LPSEAIAYKREVTNGDAVVCRARPSISLSHTALPKVDCVLILMAFPIEAIVGILGMIVALPPTIYALWKMIHHFGEKSADKGALMYHFQMVLDPCAL
jgi:hypothetical protein